MLLEVLEALPPRWKLLSNHSILRFWFSNVVLRSEEQLENLMVSSREEVAGGGLC